MKFDEQLEEIKNELKQKDEELEKERTYNKLRTQFFSNISHELKTPLNVILGTIQILNKYDKDKLKEKHSEKYDKHIYVMKQNCYRLIRLVNNIVDSNKMEGGYYKIYQDNYNIVSVVEDITLSVADYIKNKDITLIFDTDIEEKIMACSPDKIERIMLNLLSNAIKFTNPGGSINVNMYDKGDRIVISVKDTGVGIPEDELNGIFDRFQQVESTIKRNGAGSGIGLSLVKSLVEIHDGTISVKSEVGKGTEFIIEFPEKMIEKETVKPYDDRMKENHIERIDIEFSDIYESVLK